MKILNADIVRTQRLFLPHNNSGQSEEILAHHCQVIWNINKTDVFKLKPAFMPFAYRKILKQF